MNYLVYAQTHNKSNKSDFVLNLKLQWSNEVKLGSLCVSWSRELHERD